MRLTKKRDQVGQDESDNQDDDQLRQVAVDEGQSVAVPVMDDVAKSGVGGVILREHGKKEHYCGISGCC